VEQMWKKPLNLQKKRLRQLGS